MPVAMLAVVLTLSPGVHLTADAPRAASLETMTEDQLVARLVELKATRPSIVGPIVMLSVGGVLAVPGFYFLAITLEVVGKTAATMNGLAAVFGAVAGVIFGVFTVVFLLPAAILITIGAIMLPLRLSEWRAMGDEQDAIERRLRQVGPPDLAPPPPPPPPPTQANLVMPSLQVVAVF